MGLRTVGCSESGEPPITKSAKGHSAERGGRGRGGWGREEEGSLEGPLNFFWC